MSDCDTDKVCNNCKRDIPAANLDLHLSHCIKNLRLCTLCDDPIPIREFEDHIKEEHAEVECSKCKTKFQQGNEDLHLSVCSEAPILCEFCSVDFPRRLLPAHVNACGCRTEECEECGERVMLREMAGHVCRSRREARRTRLAATDLTRTSTSPYALQPVNNNSMNHHELMEDLQRNDIGTDYLDELINTEHFNPLNGSTVDLDAALAAQMAHDEQRQSTSLNNNPIRPAVGTAATPRPRSIDSDNMMLPCEFCEAMYPIEELILHQTGCLDNSITISNPALPAPVQMSDVYDSFIPCEFCCKQFPLSLVAQHQAGCTPTRRVPSFSDILDERPIRPAVTAATEPRTANTGPRTTNTGPRPTNTGPRTANTGPRTASNPAARATNRTPQAGRNKPSSSANKRRVPARNNRPVLPDSSTSGDGSEQNNELSLVGRPGNSRPNNGARGIRKELVPKPKITLSAAGKEPARVKNTRVTKSNNMNDLGKATTAISVPAVVVPKRRPGAIAPATNNSSSDNNSTETWSTLSPKIMNKNPHNLKNGKSQNSRKTVNGPPEKSSASGVHNNFPGASKKAASSKDFRINVSSSENLRVRENILSKYQKDKTLVTAGSSSKSDETS